jgi:formylglycine-generating enzyme required for sulfatase activity
LHLPVEIAAEIEAKIQAPYLVRAQQRQAYSQYFLKIAETGYRPDARQQKRLAEICQDLGLSSEDALQLNQVLTQKFNLQARPIAPPSPPVTSEDSVLTSLPLPSIGEKAPPQQPSVAQKAPPPATPVAQKTVSQKPASALQPKPLVDQANVSTTPAQYFRRRQVLKYLGFGGIGVMVAAIIANFRGLFGVSSSPSSPPPKLEPSFSPSSKSPSPTKLESFSFETVTVDQTGKIKQRQTKSAQAFTEDLGNGISLIMVQIPAGSFQMGSPTREAGRINDEGPQHPVKLPTFFIGKFEVTQAQWAAVAKLEKVNIDLNPEPANFKGSDPRGNGEAARPVEQISWFEAVEFCDRLSRKTGKTYRLPSEAEWEYACRAGTTTPFYFGETISTDLANYNGTSTYGNGAKGQYREQTTPVGSFPANAFGLHDMHGNVFEWCADHWHENYDRAPTDGSVWEAGGNQRRRCLRGCSWDNNPRVCRSAYRGRITPVYLSFNIGFRVVGCC